MSFDFYIHKWTDTEKNDFDCCSKIKLLPTEGNKETAKKMHKGLVYGKESAYTKLIEERLKYLDALMIRKPFVDHPALPPFSLFLQFTFTLATPYLSKDDEEFYIIDNPVRKDKVFKVPMISGSSWKGNMRWTAGKDIELKTEDSEGKLRKRIQLLKLFGNENEVERRYFNSMMTDKVQQYEKEINKWTNKNSLRTGRLNFYPTFFNRIGLEVINPHDRKTKAGTLPIYIESVPEGASGTFSLLYVPFDLMGKGKNVVQDEVVPDLILVCNAVREMMLTYGFSAKKSSGFGIAKNELSDITCATKEKEVKQIEKVISDKSKKMKSMSLEDFKKTGNKKKETFDDLGTQINAITSKLLSGGNNG